MDSNLIGEQIARYRKERNLTQEELGKAVGVSTQAVSRWENGGAPDVALLPAIADKLGVTVDALFGREGGERTDIQQAAARWLRTVPDRDRFDQLCRLNWTAVRNMGSETENFPDIGYRESCEMGEEGGPAYLAISQAWLEGGFTLGVYAEDMSFSSVWPQPEKGYEAYFAPRDQYRRLFRVMARPGCLELLEYFNSRTFRMYVPKTLAKALDMPLEEAEAILEELHGLEVIQEWDLQLEDGMGKAYSMNRGVTLVPFYYMARCMMNGGNFLVGIGGWSVPPLLKGEEREKEKKDEKE